MRLGEFSRSFRTAAWLGWQIESNWTDPFPTLVQLDNGQLFLILIGITTLFAVLARIVFRWCDHQARERGYIDRVSNY